MVLEQWQGKCFWITVYAMCISALILQIYPLLRSRIYHSYNVNQVLIQGLHLSNEDEHQSGGSSDERFSSSHKGLYQTWLRHACLVEGRLPQHGRLLLRQE